MDILAGRYRPLFELGRGGMADVTLAVASSAGDFRKLAVLKRIRETYASDASFRAMFLDEARLAARLDHPHVVSTFEAGEDGGVPFLAMEFLDGQPLDRLVSRAGDRGQPLSDELFARVLVDVADGLAYAHDLRDFDGRPLAIVHRDVSPSNVFVTYAGAVKLVDFGIARAAIHHAETTLGTLKGKVRYMAPEQARGARVDRRADVFAVGVLLWEHLAGCRLWAGLHDAAIVRCLGEGKIPPLPANAAARPLSEICGRAMAVEPDARYPTLTALVADVEARGIVEAPARALGRVVSELFASERDALRARVHAALEDAGGGRASPDVLTGTNEGTFGGAVSARATTSDRVAPAFAPGAVEDTVAARDPLDALVDAPSSLATTAPEHRTQRWPWIASVAIALVAVLGLLIQLLRSSP